MPTAGATCWYHWYCGACGVTMGIPDGCDADTCDCITLAGWTPTGNWTKDCGAAGWPAVVYCGCNDEKGVFETVAMGFLNLQSWTYSVATILEKGMLGMFVIIFLRNLCCFQNIQNSIQFILLLIAE